MPRIARVLTAFLLLAIATLTALAARAESESRSCQTINDQTVCTRGSGLNAASSLSCRTVKGHTACTGSDGLRCETVKGRLTCRGGTDRPRAVELPSPLNTDKDKDEDEPLALSSLPRLAAFKGQSAEAAVRAFGAPERTRLLASGARVLVWDRRDIRVHDGRVLVQPGCELQLAIARSGRIADGLLTGEPAACAHRLGLG
jgi:hypothetical protein